MQGTWTGPHVCIFDVCDQHSNLHHPMALLDTPHGVAGRYGRHCLVGWLFYPCWCWIYQSRSRWPTALGNVQESYQNLTQGGSSLPQIDVCWLIGGLRGFHALVTSTSTLARDTTDPKVECWESCAETKSGGVSANESCVTCLGTYGYVDVPIHLSRFPSQIESSCSRWRFLLCEGNDNSSARGSLSKRGWLGWLHQFSWAYSLWSRDIWGLKTAKKTILLLKPSSQHDVSFNDLCTRLLPEVHFTHKTSTQDSSNTHAVELGMEYTPALSLANNEFVSLFWVYHLPSWYGCSTCLIPWGPMSKILPVTTPEPSRLARLALFFESVCHLQNLADGTWKC